MIYEKNKKKIILQFCKVLGGQKSIEEVKIKTADIEKNIEVQNTQIEQLLKDLNYFK